MKICVWLRHEVLRGGREDAALGRRIRKGAAGTLAKT